MASRGWGERSRFSMSTAMAALVLGCTPNIATHGHRLDAAALARIAPGNSSQTDVIDLLGSPSAQATFDNHIWYYVSQRTERHSFYYETVVSQDVVAIVFDDQGTVREINRSGLDQAMDIDLVDRETPTAGNELTVLEQFLGNIGRFNPPEDQ